VPDIEVPGKSKSRDELQIAQGAIMQRSQVLELITDVYAASRKSGKI